MRSLVGIAPDHIFGLGSGPKQEVLARLLAERGDGASAIFVEDRLKTLEKTMGTPALQTCVVRATRLCQLPPPLRDTRDLRVRGEIMGLIIIRTDWDDGCVLLCAAQVPVLAGWGYNTPEQQGSAEQQG
eukprot:COSAG01_NODE_3587_length_5905_cov_36.428522_1_plen_128_part_10